MVRETRHLWVGNLPDNIREDRIREHFKRYGRVQNVKLLGRAETAGPPPGGAAANSSGVCATVAFMDIKSASKAHTAEHVLDERTLTTEYYEPAAIPSAAAGAPSAGSSPAGSGYSGSSSSVNSAPAPTPSSTRYHLSGGEESSSTPPCAAAAAAAPATWRGTNDSATEFCRRGNTPAAYGRYQRNNSQPYSTPPSNVDRTPHQRWYASGSAGGGESTPSTPGGATEPGARRRRRSGSGGGSSRSDTSSPEPSDESRASTPLQPGAPPVPNNHVNHRPGNSHQWASTASGRPLAICVRNLPTRSTDSSLKDGLYHEYKKHGKVVWVKVVGQNADRYAIVRFKKPSDVEKALEVSQDKLFFGCKISVAPHQSCEEDAESAKPYETDIDEYHPKATRTLFIGNLEKDVTQQQLRDKFKHFGRIIEIDIKKGSGGGAGYAFCQYASISSVVEAIRAMDGEYVGSSRVKLGFGKPVATTCVWVDGLTEHTEKQEAFYEQLEKHGGTAALASSERLSGDLSSRYMPPTRHDALRYEGVGSRSRASSYGRSSSRTPRYSALEHFDPVEYPADRRYRVYDELGSSPQTEEPPYEDRLQSVVVSPHRARRHRRDSSPVEHKHTKQEWHRSVSGGVVSVVAGTVTTGRRSRSGSRRRHRRRREESCSRGGTPLRDEPAPAEPRRAPLPRDRSVPMSLPLPKFALLLRAAPAPPPPAAPSAPAAPASPRPERQERPPSASSSSGGSAPHSPSMSLEERIRSLDEKYERWSRLDPPAPPPARPRHRLLEVDIHEVKPSDVVRSLLAKRSVFDEDSERLEGTVLTRPPSPGSGSPRRPRALQYPFPSHPPPSSAPPAPPEPEPESDHRVPPNGISAKPPSEPFKSERLPPELFRPTSFSFGEYSTSVKSVDFTSAVKNEQSDDRSMRTPCRSDSVEKPSDPRLNRVDRSISLDRLNTFSESEYNKQELRFRLRTPSTDKLQFENSDKKQSPKTDKDQTGHDRNATNEIERDRRRRSSVYSEKECDKAIEALRKEDKDKLDSSAERIDFKHRDIITHEVCVKLERTDSFDCHNTSRSLPSTFSNRSKNDDELKVTNACVEKLDDKPQQDKTQEQLNNSKQKSQEQQPRNTKEEKAKEDIVKIETPEETQASIDEEIAKICEFHSSQEESRIIRTPNNTPPIETPVLLRPEPKKRLSFEQRSELSNEVVENHIKKDTKSQEEEKIKFNTNTKRNKNDSFDFNHDFLKNTENGKERFNSSMMITAFQSTKLEKENIEFEKSEKAKYTSFNHTEKRNVDHEKNHEGSSKTDREKSRHHREERKSDKEKHEYEKERCRSVKHEREKVMEKTEKDKKIKEETHVLETPYQVKMEKVKTEKERPEKELSKLEREPSKSEREPNKSEKETSKLEKESIKSEREPMKIEKEPTKSEKETTKSEREPNKLEREPNKSEKEPNKSDRDNERAQKDKNDRDISKERHSDDKSSRHDHRKDKYDKRKDSTESNDSKTKKDDKHKHDRHRKDHNESKRDQKKESDSKSRKSSRDESSRDLCRKDSTDSSTSRASHESTKLKESENQEVKEENKGKSKSSHECSKQKLEKEASPKIDRVKTEESIKIKTEIKEEKVLVENVYLEKVHSEKLHSEKTHSEKEHPEKAYSEKVNSDKPHSEKVHSEKTHSDKVHPEKALSDLLLKRSDFALEHHSKVKTEVIDKPRHYSLDSPSVENKRKERLNSCSSLPSHIGHKRRMSSQDSLDSFNEESKKVKNELKPPERRDSKDSRSTERHKTPKFNKGHFAKLLESKTKDEKKNQVKTPDDNEYKDETMKVETIKQEKDNKTTDRVKLTKKSPSSFENETEQMHLNEIKTESLQNDLDFLETLKLEAKSEEDEKQKALRREMKEKKRLQQLQQIQELQMQQESMQQVEYMNKLKDDKKNKTIEEKRKEAAREKRMSTDRKSREEKSDNNKSDNKRRNRNKQVHSSDTSDSDEPKKHSIFDIVDDGPTYISMYDKVKARSCKNMQKQEEEKRQEKIKAKFSQLKQSRAKREEKKRSSWDEDSDSEHDRKKPQKLSMDSSTDDDQHNQAKKRDKLPETSFEFDRKKVGYYSTEEDSRNKMSRKNSRSRIMSDTSDDDTLKRLLDKNPSFSQIKKELSLTNIYSDESMQNDLHTSSFFSKTNADEVILRKESTDRIKKNSLLNLFGKSDSDDSKIKSGPGEINADYKSNFVKKPNDFSSESESMVSNVYSSEVRKKHKKKQRRNKLAPSDDEKKQNFIDMTTADSDMKHRHEKSRRHSTKKEKRRDRVRESVDTDESRDERSKHRKNKTSVNTTSLELAEGSINNIKKDGKMEDIFGPLSDESDNTARRVGDDDNMCDFTSNDFDTNFGVANHLTVANIEEIKTKEKDENKRRKEKRRKEKRHFMKEDENSLDLDAASKAIEAQLFDNITDEDVRQRCETIPESTPKQDLSDYIYNTTDPLGDDKKNYERSKKDNKDKKKKKKRSKEDRQIRKEHHHFHHHDKISYSEPPKHDLSMIDLSDKDSQQENIEFTENRPAICADKPTDSKSSSDSSSLPRLTESPPINSQQNTESDVKNISSDASGELVIVEDMEISYEEKKEANTDQTETAQPIKTPELASDTSVNVKTPEKSKPESFLPTFGSKNDQTVSEYAVRSIPNLDKKSPQVTVALETQVAAPKVDDKLEEKPRAVISQEETEDAVAALLGESFGGNDMDFSFDDDDNSSNQMESTANENGNMPEEDAEEMRRAVQNLNASEMEMKPDTPMSDNDLLLIDTDTEEADETPQDTIDKTAITIITTNPTLNSEQAKTDVVVPKSKPEEIPNMQAQTSAITSADINNKVKEKELKLSSVKRDVGLPMTSAPTPVITSWSLSNNKLREPQLLNISKAQMSTVNDNKTITASIIQLKAPPVHNIQQQNPGSIRPMIGTPNRMSAPYQVLNQMIRTQVPNMQPPTIKIPDSHILYQKQQNIVLSPRMAMDPRMQSPKGISQGEGITSPRLTNMAILTTSPQNMNSVGLTSPNNLPQRSPGHVTVVRMQQPPLSPIQAMHLPHGTRAMVSPNRPNSVLVQTTGTPIHFNRLPVAPVLAPISKQLNPNNIVQQNKDIRVVTSQIMHQQKNIPAECRKTDQMSSESSKLILSPTNLQQSTNPTVMAQNRLISMQNALHVGNINSTLKLSNKVLLNNVAPLGERKDPNVQFRPELKKSDQHNHMSFGSPPIIHVAGVNHSSGHIIQSCSKPIMIHDPINSTREQGSNVIHSINSPRLLTTASISNVIQIDANKVPTSVLSMSALRSPTVLTRLDSSRPVAATTSTLTNVVMTPLILKTNTTLGTVRISNKPEPENHTSLVLQNTMSREIEEKVDNSNKLPGSNFDPVDRRKELLIKPVKPPTPTTESNTKCEMDFEELLRDNTNEIKVTKDGEKKLEVNVGKTVTTHTQNLFIREQSSITQILQVREPIPVSKPIEPLWESKSLYSGKPVTESPVPSKEETNVKQENNQKPIEIETKEDLPAVLNEANKTTSEKPPSNITSIGIPSTNLADFGKTLEDSGSSKDDDKPLAALISEQSNDSDIMKKQIDESDSWTAKDINIESVIKKVDSLCNDSIDENSVDDIKMNDSESLKKTESPTATSDPIKPMDTSNTTSEENMELSTSDEFSSDRSNSGKRGGRSNRGKKSNRNQDRVQTRQIAKPPRGGGAKRGRGRANTDKKIKNAINASANNLPGDVYDFHEDSGDESNTSAKNKSEARPRLILTIKSPLSGQTPAIASSSLSITTPTPVKDQAKLPEKLPGSNKDEKMEEFVSPSSKLASNNTRKSRRLLQKVVERSTVDDVIEDVVKGTAVTTRGAKDPNKKRPTRQAGAKANQEKVPGSDARKSPRGVKRTRDRSLSDASLDSSDEKTTPKKDESPKEAKIAKVVEILTPPVCLPSPTPTKIVELEPPKVNPIESVVKTNNASVPVINTPPATTPTPIMKPPKKMILASAFEATASPAPIRNTTSPSVAEKIEKDLDAPANKLAAEADELSIPYREARNLECAKTHSIGDELMPPAATAEARPDPGFRRLIDAAPGNALPVGALEATDARVQSPALPHRPPSIPSIHRPADRATPVLMRAGEGGAHGYRPAYAGTASLPRGAHHPPPPQPPHPAHPHLKPQHHHHHPGTAARMNVTSVPHVSPQGQIGLGEGMYPHFSRQHYQMFQQHFHATQHENRASPLPYTRSLEAEGSEAPTPPLELRRPPSARVPRPAHSPAPADRLIMYGVVGGRSPPPAHAGRPPSALPPPGPSGPPHASQVPREADSLQMLLRRYPVMWQGLLALKNDSAAVQMHFVGGNPNVAGNTLPRHTDGSTPPLRIAQRMRLEPAQLEQVHRKMKMENEHCMLLALPCGRDHMDVLQQSTNLTGGFITYLQRKQAAGIVNVAPPGHHQAMYTVHIFPSCDFANENLNRIAPDLMHRVADIAHLLIVIATV